MAGVFSEWQPRYAEAGIATFPVREKRPAVKGYLQLGARVSEQLAFKFANDNAFGFACKRSRIVIVDVDTPDESVLADALAEHGPTPVIVRSGSGNWQAWYRHNGEDRQVRPDPEKPIDILGDGFVVAPPSLLTKGPYQFIQGGLSDVATLPKRQVTKGNETHHNILTPPSSSPLLPPEDAFGPKIGERNEALFRTAMELARRCDTIEQLMEKVMQVNATYYEPMPADEVLKVIASAWGYQVGGKNWVGGRGRAILARDEILAFPGCHTLRLLLLLRASHDLRSEPFAISQIEVGDLLGVTRQAVSNAIQQLIEHGLLRRVYIGGKGRGDPHKYVLVEVSDG